MATLPDLLVSRAHRSSNGVGYLDSEGRIVKFLSYFDLLDDATKTSQQLLAAGLDPATDIVISSFADHESHIRVFWACCLAGIRICPIPPLHPDPSRRALFFKHLQDLFHRPTVIACVQTIHDIKAVVPDIKAVSLLEVEALSISDAAKTRVFPARQPVPDDIVCLMLTSGSTGNSKAVALRHSNLLSSIRGKIKHHGTNSASRFFNWIAFDHVACVSEIHLQALEVNAMQYHAAPSSIIRSPRNLLDWCSRLRITYSFSPNFLIAQICRDIAAIPYPEGSFDLSHMQAFISGGESVPVKTAVEFSDIIQFYGAPRNALRAGFGMSETGAGCIYDTRPILCDSQLSSVKYLSLGKCCDGTSLRIVDPETGVVRSTCEVGQLQINGPTVFLEYYNNSRATDESFTSDGWFITGDTAYIDQDGNLHLTGRDKDFININGVKHPSVDVEHFIEDSAIAGVMRSFVFVCPMRLPDYDTESYAVFYQHILPVETQLSKEDVLSIEESNRAIRNVCIIFCSRAPHVTLPLPRHYFTKTALGKVSRSALVKSYLEGSCIDLEAIFQAVTASIRSSETTGGCSREITVFEAIAEIFDINVTYLNRSQTLFDIGASSMHLMRLKHTLQERLGIRDLPTIEMLRRPEIGQLCDYLNDLLSASAGRVCTPTFNYNPVICLNPRGSKPPVFLVHPGVGEVLVFVNLARILDDDRPLFALRARGFDVGEATFTSFDEMVDTYTTAIEEIYPDGPYFIAGYSFGGAVAFEIGKELESRGKHVAWLGILNLPPHIQFRMMELTWTEVLTNIFMFLDLVPASSFESVRSDFYSVFPAVALSDAEPDSAPLLIDWLLTRSDPVRLRSLNLNIDDLRRWTNVAYAVSCLGRTYEPSGAVQRALTTVFCATPLPSMGNRAQYKDNHLFGWRDFSSNRLEFVDVDGEHYTMLDDANVESFAKKMRAAMKRAASSLMPLSPSPSISRRQLDFEEVPTIDFSLLESDTTQYFEQLRFALEDIGFGVFINVPGFEDAFQMELFALAERLFRMPQEWKNVMGTAKSYALRGYFRADNVPGPHKAYAEAYRFGLDLPEPTCDGDRNVPFWLKLHEGPNQWPPETDLPRFREKMEILFERYYSLNLTLNRHICRLLDIPQASLDDYFPEKTEFNSAIWHYLPVTSEIRAAARNGFAQGMHEHRDPSTFLTCLIQSRPGLEVQNHRGDWIDVPMVKGGVVCNIGMQLMKLTGGKLVATTHRVNTLKIEEDRYTIPYVLSTRLDKPVTPLPQYDRVDVEKSHVAPNPKILKLMEVKDPLVRSGYARLSLFPAATQKLYPEEFEQARRLGIV